MQLGGDLFIVFLIVEGRLDLIHHRLLIQGIAGRARVIHDVAYRHAVGGDDGFDLGIIGIGDGTLAYRDVGILGLGVDELGYLGNTLGYPVRVVGILDGVLHGVGKKLLLLFVVGGVILPAFTAESVRLVEYLVDVDLYIEIVGGEHQTGVLYLKGHIDLGKGILHPVEQHASCAIVGHALKADAVNGDTGKIGAVVDVAVRNAVDGAGDLFAALYRLDRLPVFGVVIGDGQLMFFIYL